MKHPKTREQRVSLESIFGTQGWLASHHPGYEHRPAQLEMAELIESTLRGCQHAVAEAGTGTGKTLAYLVPILLSGKKVVISAATKNLQEQLYFKDIAFLRKLFPGLRASLMKGRSNYLCRQKVYDIKDQPFLNAMEEVDQFKEIRQWEKSTETGDRSELEHLPDSSDLWRRIDARRETCTGQKCKEFDRCFITKMHQKATDSDLIIVNHHLFFADLALRQTDSGGLIPEYSAVVFDEAHEIEDVATQYFGVQVSNHQLKELIRDSEVALTIKGFEKDSISQSLERLRLEVDSFFSAFPFQEGRFNFGERESFIQSHGHIYQALQNALTRLSTEFNGLTPCPEEINNLIRRTQEIQKVLRFVLESTERNFVYWWERRGQGLFLEASPIDISEILEKHLFDRVGSVVLISATLSVGDDFHFLKKRLGISYAKERILPSPFDYSDQALLYMSNSLPDPRAKEFSSQAADVIVDVLKASKGRAFVLCTSHQQMGNLYERIRNRIPYEVYVQGTAPKTNLLDRFRRTPNAVLFATSSFWHGVDVQGEQLSAVIIDRLPFAVPTDPVIAARIKMINEDGGNAFTDYQIPDAIIRLKQGFGRLLRSQSDRGILCLLDNRIAQKAYGRLFLESLPPYRISRDLEEVRRFMQE